MATAIPVIPEDAYDQILSEAQEFGLSTSQYAKVLELIRKAYHLGINETKIDALEHIKECASYVSIGFRN